MEFREILKNTNLDFIGIRNKTFAISAVLLCLGLVAFVMISFGKANMSIDFTGGTSLQIKFADVVSIGDLRDALTDGGLRDVQIQEVSGTGEFLVKTKMTDTEKEKVQDIVGQVISTKLTGKKYEILGSNMVGSSVGKTLKKNAIIAVVISLIGIIIYIAWRFTYVFGLAAAIATFHDVIVMLGIFWALGEEMNILFITALLTIAGYSLTDTVVVFDRIRENMAKMKSKSDLGAVINVSINEVLSRTIVTSLTVLLVLAALLVLGGKVLFEFSLALVIGVIIGTYSSIFVASPLVFLLRNKVR
ncbi:MAG: protein translocase subunit SecF [Syntrophobacterales bacterium]|jgi:preprotein translocase SecF subunit|nr:protein translocase subunit SecF [Syntrophobacterales bacterium]